MSSLQVERLSGALALLVQTCRYNIGLPPNAILHCETFEPLVIDTAQLQTVDNRGGLFEPKRQCSWTINHTIPYWALQNQKNPHPQTPRMNSRSAPCAFRVESRLSPARYSKERMRTVLETNIGFLCSALPQHHNTRSLIIISLFIPRVG